MLMSFDVFLSYHSADRDAALLLAAELASMGLGVFVDVQSLRPGTDWGRELEEALQMAPAIAVLVGPDDIGPTQEREVRHALDRQAAARDSGRPLPVVPVILPRARQSARVPFVNQNTWINLSAGIENRSELDRLYFGITGRQRVRQKLADSEHAASNGKGLVDPDVVLQNLVPRLAEGGVSFFLGGGVSRPPTPHQLAVELTDRVRELNPGLPVIHTLDLAGSCYVVKRGGEELAVEDSLREYFARHVTQLAPPLHESLARLARAFSSLSGGLGESAAGLRGPETLSDSRRTEQQNMQPLIIVCTTYDLTMERALLREGVSFIRFVQNHAKNSVDFGEYDVTRDGPIVQFLTKGRDGAVIEREVDRESQRELDKAIASYGSRLDKAGRGGRRPAKLPFMMSRTGKAPAVVLYKPLGSRDVLGSCCISSDHHLELVRRALQSGAIPDQITEVVRNSRIVFLGYSFFDPILRLLRYTLLLERTWSVPSYIVKTLPAADEVSFDLQLEAALWNEVRAAWPKKDLTLVESAEGEFVDALLAQFSARYGRACV